MALPVDVSSIDVLRDFRAQLCRFGEDCKNGLAAAEMEISRMVDWLTNDRRLYWQAEIRRRQENLSQAKADMHRKRTSQMFGQDASLAEQRENLRVAKFRLEEAEEKLEHVRRWAQPLQQAIMEYRGQSRPLADMLDSEHENNLALLDRMITALEEYVGSSPVSTDYVREMRDSRRASGADAPAATTSPDQDEALEAGEGETSDGKVRDEAESDEGPGKGRAEG
jgi:hypothetical protein